MKRLLRQYALTCGACFVLLLVSAPQIYALDLDPQAIRGEKSKTPVNVLQNRYFLKAFRPEFGVILGTFLNEAYTDTTVTGLRGGMFLTEWVGFEVQHMKATVKDTADRKALNRTEYFKKDVDENGQVVPGEIVTPDTETNPMKTITDVNIVLAPFYGKLNLFNKIIVYSDLYVTAGMAKVDTEQGSKNALSFGAGQRFYIQDNFSVRVDFRDRVFTEKRAGKDSRRNAISFDMGASYFFN